MSAKLQAPKKLVYNGTNSRVHTTAHTKIARTLPMTMESPDHHTGMRMFVNADVTHLTAILTQVTVVQ